MQQRQPHAHINIIRSKPHETKSGQPICPDCLKEWDACFSKPSQKSFEFVLT